METAHETYSKFLISSDIGDNSYFSTDPSFMTPGPKWGHSRLETVKRLFEIQIWTLDDLALVLNCSKGSIYNKVSKDEIPFHKKGEKGRLYFIPSEILDWIKEGEFR